MVELVKQDFKENKKQYTKIENELRQELGNNIPINHVGSTAIPSMYGKNIIDILIGAEDNIQFNNIKKVLERNGYFGSEKSKTDIYQFFASSNNETTSGDIHIHLVNKNTDRYLDFLILKEYLLNNKGETKNYSDFKRQLINSGTTDREEYKREKSEYVSQLIERARKNTKKFVVNSR